MRLMLRELKELARDKKDITAMRYLIEARRLILLKTKIRVEKKVLEKKIADFIQERKAEDA